MYNILCKQNLKTFNDYQVLIEGAKYTGVWLETQPIGGEMYAKRNMKTALSNILIFIRQLLTLLLHWSKLWLLISNF